MNILAWLVFVAAAVLEVGGDAVMRKGVRGGGLIFIIVGALILGCYGWMVNVVKWDFSKLLGVYVAVFAVVAIVVGRFWFKENVPASTWLGLAVIIVGGLIIQFGAPIISQAKSEVDPVAKTVVVSTSNNVAQTGTSSSKIH